VRWYRPGGDHTSEEIAREFADFVVRGVSVSQLDLASTTGTPR
jgi:hypothetical protein